MSWLKKSPSEKASSGHDVAALKGDIVDKISAAIMMIDRDFIVTYVNGPTRELLRKNAVAFAAIWPGFDAEKIIGCCIDMFHKNPAHQRQMLSDPSRLPIRTEITIGDLKVALLVNGCFDARGNHVGNVLEWQDVTQSRLNEGMLASINKVQAVIEFDTTGKIQHANENFLNALGYTLGEIQGQHHSMFVEPAYRSTPEYREFWAKLARGEYDANQYKRIGKGGKEVWIQASYNPILDAKGKAFKVVKFATDVTPQVLASKALQLAVRQTQDAVNAAKDNDLTQRIPMQGKTGEIETLCAGVNSLLELDVDGDCRDQNRGARSHQCVVGNLRQHHRPVAAHRGAGRQPGRDLGFDGGNLRDREKECRERQPGQSFGERHPRGRRSRRPGGGQGGRSDGADRGVFA